MPKKALKKNVKKPKMMLRMAVMKFSSPDSSGTAGVVGTRVVGGTVVGRTVTFGATVTLGATVTFGASVAFGASGSITVGASVGVSVALVVLSHAAASCHKVRVQTAARVSFNNFMLPMVECCCVS